MPAPAFLVWQLVDSALPTGGFAHSAGLEAAVQLGAVRTREDLARFAAASLDSAAHASLPYLAAAHAAPGDLPALDRRLDAYTTSRVANRASRAQGEALLRTAAGAFGDEAAALAATARAEKLPCHLATVEGALLAVLGVGLDEARRMFLFAQLRAIASAAVRLGVVGPVEAQALQARLAPAAEVAARASEGVALDEAAATTPLLDLWQGHQERLYSRLFRS